MVRTWIVGMSTRARMEVRGSRIWSAAPQPDGACAARLANLALAGATAHEITASAQGITASRLARAAAASDTCGNHAPPSGRAHSRPPHAHTTRTARCPLGAYAARTTLTAYQRVWAGAVVGGTCRRVAKCGAAARRYDAMVYRWSTGAARGGPRELRRCARWFLFRLLSSFAAAHPTTFHRRSYLAAAAGAP